MKLNYIISSIRYRLSNIQYPVSSIQHLVSRIQYPVSSIILILLLLIPFSCIEEKDTTEEMPSVEIIAPFPCDTLYFGEAFECKIKITDNTGLGNIYMDCHNNFGHHSHGDHESCNMDEAKDAVNPYINDWQFSLPSNQLEYLLDTLLILPDSKNDSTDFDTGDYHFHMYVTDDEGYQSFTTFDVKILK